MNVHVYICSSQKHRSRVRSELRSRAWPKTVHSRAHLLHAGVDWHETVMWNEHAITCSNLHYRIKKRKRSKHFSRRNVKSKYSVINLEQLLSYRTNSFCGPDDGGTFFLWATFYSKLRVTEGRAFYAIRCHVTLVFKLSRASVQTRTRLSIAFYAL